MTIYPYIGVCVSELGIGINGSVRIDHVTWKNFDGTYHVSDKANSVTSSSVSYSFIINHWFNSKGVLNRINGPCHVSYSKNGIIKYESWYKNGVPFRLNGGPDRIDYHYNGKIRSGIWRRKLKAKDFGYDHPTIRYYEQNHIKMINFYSGGQRCERIVKNDKIIKNIWKMYDNAM